MFKRKLDEFESDLSQQNLKRTYNQDPTAKKHSLDSDEEDDKDEDNLLDADDIEGEEEGVSRQIGEQRMTAFNMKEELEEGHFDRDGHFIWNNEKEIRDNWLDNIDWQKVKTSSTKYILDPTAEKGLADDTSSESESEEDFDEIETYKKILTYMKPKENINKAIRRLGGDERKLSSLEKLRRKKAGTLVTNEDVSILTELANKILTKKGNMDIYQETFESISNKIENNAKKGKAPVKADAELDMYADDFGEKEQAKLGTSSTTEEQKNSEDNNAEKKETMWEFKWAQENNKIEGPFTSSQMLKWVNDGYFKTGVWVRKHGDKGQFYTSNRIDFDLYI